MKFFLKRLFRFYKSKMYLYCFVSCICIYTTSLKAQNYGGNYDWRMLGGGPLQLFSFHFGTSSSINHNKALGYNVGASIGWNYLSSFYNTMEGIDHIFDIGIRMKYSFSDATIKTHAIGAEIYLHFPCSTTDLFRNAPQPFSLIIGGGSIFVRPENMSLQQNLNGGYVEVGVGVFKYFPININFLYRWSFFHANSLGIDPVEQSFHVEFAIF